MKILVTILGYTPSLLLCFFYLAYSSRVFTQYDGLEEDYWRWKMNPSPTRRDIISFNKAQKYVLCYSFKRATTFVYLKTDTTKYSADMSKADLKTSTSYLNPEIIERKMIIDSREDTVPMFLCTSDRRRNSNFYLTSANMHDYVFVIIESNANDSENSIEVSILGLLHSRPDIDNERGEAFSFWQSTTSTEVFSEGRNTPPMMSNLCSITQYKHFNLCSVVANALKEKSEFHPLLRISTMNFIYNIPYVCVDKTISDLNNDRKVETEVLPCAINEDWSKAQFYLLGDNSRTQFASVYVLKPRENGTLELFARVDKVMAVLPTSWSK